MTINQINCFVEAAKIGNISKAADSLFITQQAASNQIKNLEKELGFAVLKRENKGVSLTEEGRILFEEWVDIREKLRISIDKARDYHAGQNSHIHVALEDMGKCSEDIMMAFSEYEDKYKDLHIHFEIMSPRQMISQLETEDLDIAILYESELEKRADLKVIPLHDKLLQVRLFLSKTHPLASRKNLTLQDIINEPIGILGKGSSHDFERQIHRFFAYHGLEAPRTYKEYASRRDLEIGLIAGRCVTTVYETMFIDAQNKLLSWEIETGPLSSRMTICWKKESMNIKARALSDILKERLKKYS